MPLNNSKQALNPNPPFFRDTLYIVYMTIDMSSYSNVDNRSLVDSKLINVDSRYQHFFYEPIRRVWCLMCIHGVNVKESATVFSLSVLTAWGLATALHSRTVRFLTRQGTRDYVSMATELVFNIGLHAELYTSPNPLSVSNKSVFCLILSLASISE